MGHENQPIRIAPNGRLSIPANQRKALGLERGGMVVSTVENGELRLRAAGVTSDTLIAERRAEAEQDEQASSSALAHDCHS